MITLDTIVITAVLTLIVITIDFIKREVGRKRGEEVAESSYIRWENKKELERRASDLIRRAKKVDLFFGTTYTQRDLLDVVEGDLKAQHELRLASGECGLSNTAAAMRELGISEEVINEINE